jgi:hypothetical protein
MGFMRLEREVGMCAGVKLPEEVRSAQTLTTPHPPSAFNCHSVV